MAEVWQADGKKTALPRPKSGRQRMNGSQNPVPKRNFSHRISLSSIVQMFRPVYRKQRKSTQVV